MYPQLAMLSKIRTLNPDTCCIVRFLESFVSRGHVCLVFEKLDVPLTTYKLGRRYNLWSLIYIRPIIQQVWWPEYFISYFESTRKMCVRIWHSTQQAKLCPCLNVELTCCYLSLIMFNVIYLICYVLICSWSLPSKLWEASGWFIRTSNRITSCWWTEWISPSESNLLTSDWLLLPLRFNVAASFSLFATGEYHWDLNWSYKNGHGRNIPSSGKAISLFPLVCQCWCESRVNSCNKVCIRFLAPL